MITRDAATIAQVNAADPRMSTWLSANAGSGKTRVLTDRVARLLLDGVQPQNILCLTYTKAAASEMQNRLFKRLGAWAMMPDQALHKALADLGEETAPDARQLARARRLFAQAMEVPGGLRIQTIHSFCGGLLRRFPLEAGVSPAFREMEDRDAAALRAEVADTLAIGPQRPLVDALALQLTGDTLDALLSEIVGKQALFRHDLDESALRLSLGLAPSDTVAGLVDRVFGPDGSEILTRLQPLLAAGSANDRKAAATLAFLRRDAPGLADLALLEDVFLTGDSAKEPFAAKTGKFPTKATRAADPDLMEALDALMARVEAARGTRIGLQSLDRTRALHAFARAFLPAYAARKMARGLLDFDDLIVRAQGLLTDPAVAAWVLFKLDGGIDHILVDEAQDTSPGQWAVIERLAQDFAAGDGARPGRTRTIFVVGDKKQSIYSFQGADPDAFDRMQAHFARDLARIDADLRPLRLAHSFRSAMAILRVVDATFQGPARDGLGPDDPSHIAFHEAMPGRVDVWPPLEPEETGPEEAPDWTDPVDRPGPADPRRKLARAIAAQVAGLLETGSVPAQIGGEWVMRPVTGGDILVLVRRRSGIFGPIIEELKAAGLPVAGADRMRVGAELAVRDLVALLRVLALPEDDLSLAAALRSPLFGWSEQDLFTLAHHRPDGAYLWQALRASGHAQTLAMMDDLRGQADFLRPYDLLNRILTRHDGRRRLLARLGPEAEDGIDALLSQALGFEKTHVPDLTGFLDWVETDDLEVKRQVEARSGRIRVMTVHGAKGLESPIVILPDTGDWSVAVRDAVLAETPDGPAHWAAPRDSRPAVQEDLRADLTAAQDRERRRLLYVAMTRAESWLIVASAGAAGPESWHGMIRAGVDHSGAVTLATPVGEGLRHESGDWGPATVGAERTAPGIDPVPWDFGSVGPIRTEPGTLSPSDLGGAKVLPGDDPATGADTEAALDRGRILHLLLEQLPGLAPDLRKTRAEALVAQSGTALPGSETAALIADALRLCADPDLAAILGPGALAEVTLTAEVDGARLHGAVDRLIVTPDRIRIVDFKTNRRVPDRPEDVPEGLLRQMAAYRAMAAQVWPGRPVEVAILWTATGTLMPLPDPILTDALTRWRAG